MTEFEALRPYRLAVVNSHPIQYFAPLYRRLAQDPGIDLTVYYCSRAGVEPYEDAGFGGERFAWDVPLVAGYDHEFLPNLRGDRRPAGFWSLVNPAIMERIRRADHDAVWVHGHAYASYILAVLGALVAGSSVFMRCETHGELERSRIRRLLRRLIMPGFYRLLDVFLSIGTRNAEFYRCLGVREDRIVSVPYVVENRRFRDGAELSEEQRRRRRRELGLPDHEVPVILYLSKLTPRKRPMDVIRAFREIRSKSGKQVALAIVGDGPERVRLERFVEQHSIPDVYFLGFRNQAELPAIYGACDVFVLPSENEPWGLVVNEAMCAGLPVVVSEEVGAAPDLVADGRNGFQFPARDVDVLADRLHRLVSDSELRSEMGRSSRAMIEEWDFEACVSGVKTALEKACGPRSKGASLVSKEAGSLDAR